MKSVHGSRPQCTSTLRRFLFWKRCVTATLLILALADRSAAEDKHPSDSNLLIKARQAVEHSLPFLEKEGLAWLEKRKCIACHHGAFMLWSHEEARMKGFAVDEKKLAEWNTRSLTLYLKNRKENEAKKKGGVEAHNLLLGQIAYASAEQRPDADLKAVASLLVNAQQNDGFWKYEGQGLKLSDAETDETTTAWAILALASWGKDLPTATEARVRAQAWIHKKPRGESSEALVLRLLLSERIGERNQVEILAKELVHAQGADGGWSWTKDRASDPFATGQSLYALARAGRTHESEPVRKGWQYLISSQRPDGGWNSPSRKPGVKENPIAHYWGSAWATIGLARSLPAVELPAQK